MPGAFSDVPTSKTNNNKNGRRCSLVSRTYKDMPLRVHGKRRKEIDARRLARVVIALAQAEGADIPPKSTRQRPADRGDGDPAKGAA